MDYQFVSYLHVKMKISDNSLVFWLCSYFLYHSTTEAIRVVNGAVSVTEGDSANLTCVLTETDEDLEQLTWQKRTREIPQNHNFLVIIPPQDVRHVDGLGHRVRFTGNLTKKTGAIELLDVSLQDEGVYTCIFTVFPSGPHQTEIRLNVRVRPVVTVMPAAPLVVGSGSGTLVTCTAANGRPAAGVSWRIDQLDSPVEFVKNTTQNPNGTTTVRSNLRVAPTRSMHGREVQCVVNHTALEYDEIVPYRISVHYAPQSVNMTLNTTSSEGPIFQCDVDANPAPTTYTWSRVNGEVLSPSIRPEGGRLVFLKMGSELNGLYVCEASNQYGQITGTLFVYTGVSRGYYGGLLAGILVLFCLLSICTWHTLFQQRNSRGSRSLRVHQEIELLDMEEQEVTLQDVEQQEVALQDVEQQEVALQDVEQQEVALHDVEQQEVALQDVEQQEVALHDVEQQEVALQDVEQQEVALQDVEQQEVALQDVEQQEVALHDVEQQEVALQDVEQQEVALHDVEQQEVALHDVEQQEVALQDVEQQEVTLQDVEQQEVALQDVEQQEVALQDVEQQEVALHDVEQQEVALQDVEQQEVALHDVEQQEVALQDVEQQEVALHDVEQQEVALQDVEQQEVALHDVEQQEVALQDVEQQEVALHDVEQQEVALHDVEQQEVGLQDVEQQEVGLQDVEQQEVALQDVEQQEVGLQDVEQQEVGLQDAEQQEVEQQDVEQQEVEQQKLGIQDVKQQEMGMQDVDMLKLEQLGVEQKEVGMQEI